MTTTTPITVDVTAGKDYWWCACGKSAKQPFCDSSHKGSGLSPVKYTATADAKVTFCVCKKTANRPFCDGSHSR